MRTNTEWWKQTANHIWRTYFTILRTQGSNPDSLLSLSRAELTSYNVCNIVCRNLPVPSDIDILRMYYNTPKGQELHNVEQYALDHNIPVNTIWNAIRHANRAVVEEIGLIDRKRPVRNVSESP